MDKHEYVMKHLAERRGEWPDIARASGVTSQTIRNVMALKNPTMATINKLYGHLKTLRGKVKK